MSEPVTLTLGPKRPKVFGASQSTVQQPQAQNQFEPSKSQKSSKIPMKNTKKPSTPTTKQLQQPKPAYETMQEVTISSDDESFHSEEESEHQTYNAPPQRPATTVLSFPPSKPQKPESDSEYEDYYTESEDDVKYPDTPKKQESKKEEKKEEVTKAPESVHTLYQELNLDDSKLDRGYTRLEEWQQKILNELQPLEQEQQENWYIQLKKYLSDNGYDSDPDTIANFKEIAKLATDTYSHHRFITRDKSVDYRFKLAISGPNKSGKSTFVSVFATQLLAELVATDNYKHYFFYFIDCSVLGSLSNNLQDMYKYLVSTAFTLLSIQLPLLIQHREGLINTFNSILTGCPILPQSFILSPDFKNVIADLQNLINIISNCWKDSTALNSFITNILLLPVLLSKIFGFKRAISFFDHIDLADIVVNPQVPFLSSTEGVFLIEHLKLVAEQTSYLISVKDSTKLYNCLSATSNDCIDLNHSLEVITTIDLIPEPNHSEKEFVINLDKIGTKINLNANHFGGCPVLLKRWDELNELVNEMDEMASEEEDTAEQQIFLNALMQTTLNLLFISEDAESLIVKNVTRIDTKE